MIKLWLAKNGKKWIGLFLCLGMLLLSGCGNQVEECEETTELFSSYAVSQSGVLKGDGYGYLHFWDKESEQIVYLCNKAGCRHQDSSCSAYIDNLMTAFFADGHLYFFQVEAEEQIKITKADRYGENRKVVGYIQGLPLVKEMKIVEGKLYVNCILYDKETETNRYQCYTMNLSDGKIVELPMPKIEDEIGGMANFAVTDSYYYYTYALSDINLNDYLNMDTGELSEVPWEEIEYTYRLYQINRESGEERILIEECANAEQSFALQILEVTQEYVLLYWDQQVLQYDVLTGERQVRYDLGEQDNSYSIKKAGDYYVLLELNGLGNYYVLQDWQEIGDFSANIGTCLGLCGENVYFEGDGKLYYIEYENFKAGNYEVMEIVM